MEEHTNPSLHGWALSAITCIYKRDAEGALAYRRKESNMTVEGETSNAATSQGMSRNDSNQQKQEENHKRELNPDNILILDSWPLEL